MSQAISVQAPAAVKTYTALVFNYTHTDYNEPAYRKDFSDPEEAKKAAKERFATVDYGRAEVAPVNPQTGLHDLPAIWQEERKFHSFY